MIQPQETWCIQIDVTNACHLHCSNCTRLLDHAKPRFFMSPECFERAVISLKDFPTTSAPCRQGRRKVVGMIGGEPLLHPKFPELVDIICRHIPQPYHRGLWTSKNWKEDKHPAWGAHAPQVYRLLGPQPGGDVRGPSHRHSSGYLNWNMHLDEMNVHHQPMLVSISDVVQDEQHKWELIQNCWVQREWSGSITDKGAFFCEVAAAFDQVFKGPGGLEPVPGWWKGEITFVPDERGVPQPQGPFAEQINTWCQRCGACLPLRSRRDKEDRDDISQSNFVALEALGSPRVKKGNVVLYDGTGYDEEKIRREGWTPNKYIRGGRGPAS